MEGEVENLHGHHHTGHPWLDKVLPVCALFVSLVSILIAWHHSEIMSGLVEQNERLVEANSLPFLKTNENTTTREDGGGDVIMSLANNGVGPADIRSFELRLDGEPVARYTDLIQAFGFANGELVTGSPVDRMIRPGDSFTYFSVISDDSNHAEVRDMVAAVQADRLVPTVCYCSVFEECWTTTRGERPRPVAQCVPEENPYR